MIHSKPPGKFNPRFHVVSCYLEYDGKILLLLRPKQKSQGGKWGVPAGKIDKGEDEETAMLRELKEETNLSVEQESLRYFQKLYVRYPEYDFVYSMFYSKLPNKPVITLSAKEHKDFKWLTPTKALKLNLVDDLGECIKLFYRV